MNDHAFRRSDRATRVQTFGTANAADFDPGSKAALLFPALDSILEKLLGARVGQLRTPGRQARPARRPLHRLQGHRPHLPRYRHRRTRLLLRLPADYTEATAAIETLLGEAKDLVTRLDTVMHNKYSRNPDKLLAWKIAARVERAGRKTMAAAPSTIP